jgi:hypothetical protein
MHKRRRRPGRPRKEGARTPSGRLSRAAGALPIDRGRREDDKPDCCAELATPEGGAAEIIIDGHHRWRACKEVSVKPKYLDRRRLRPGAAPAAGLVILGCAEIR